MESQDSPFYLRWMRNANEPLKRIAEESGSAFIEKAVHAGLTGARKLQIPGLLRLLFKALPVWLKPAVLDCSSGPKPGTKR